MMSAMRCLPTHRHVRHADQFDKQHNEESLIKKAER
jgi:hypothetical protein